MRNKNKLKTRLIKEAKHYANPENWKIEAAYGGRGYSEGLGVFKKGYKYDPLKHLVPWHKWECEKVFSDPVLAGKYMKEQIEYHKNRDFSFLDE